MVVSKESDYVFAKQGIPPSSIYFKLTLLGGGGGGVNLIFLKLNFGQNLAANFL